MIDQNVLARLHLSAVLQNIEEIVEYDPEAKKIAGDWNHVLQFSCPGGIAAHIEFGGGKARVFPGTTAMPDIGLWFPAPLLLNRMFTGEGFTVPIPWMGAWKIALLKGFTKLAERLEFFLKPDEKTLSNKNHLEFHTRCLMNTAVFGLKAVGEHDDHVRPLIASARDGVVEFRIKKGPAAFITVKNGRLHPHKGPAKEPSVVMELKNYETAFGLFSGKLDAMALMGACDLTVQGYIPLIDKLNAALDRLPAYLN